MACPNGGGLPHRRHHFLGGRQRIALAHHLLAVHEDRELALGAVGHFHPSAELPPQCVRHTGGVFSEGASNRTLSDRHLAHQTCSFPGLPGPAGHSAPPLSAPGHLLCCCPSFSGPGCCRACSPAVWKPPSRRLGSCSSN